jgi:hypothetical protein
MGGIVRVNAPDPLEEYVNSADEVYGSGVDGSVQISSNTSLSSDMFYFNLTIDDGVVLNTNGYRIFVKNYLHLGDGAVIGLPGGFDGSGSIMGGGSATESVENSLGGNGAATSAVAPTAANGGSIYYRMASQAILGYQITASSEGPVYLRGGAGGTSDPGGGVVIVSARYISTSGSSQIAATGGPDAGGGVVIVVSTASVLNSGITMNVSGQGSGTSGTAIYIEVD